ncbi:S8 family serine peptidase [Nocardioidaceae bacterium]|nr:S8 family serine peptidase [Nocardioidaceae bacterium]
MTGTYASRLATGVLTVLLGVSGLLVSGAPSAGAVTPVAPTSRSVLDPGTPVSAGAWIVLTRTVADRDAVLAGSGAQPTYTYGQAVSGFAADLDAAAVRRLASDDRVVRLEPVVRQRLAGVGPSRLTAAARGDLPGLDTAFANVGGSSRAGAGVVVGFVDSGLWPDSPVFAPVPAQSGARAAFAGTCATGPDWPSSACTDKVVGARWFVEGFGRGGLSSLERVSPRDVVGHGTEVASLAVGDADVVARVGRSALGQVRGAAPAASAAVYKACWTAPDPDDDGCATSDVVAALDAAVADGVDVVVYGAAGTRAGDAVSRALLGVRDAGIVPVTPAGNGATITEAVPWGLTVGASRTLTRPGSVDVSGGPRLEGTMVAEGLSRPAPLLRSVDLRARGVGRTAAALCRPGSLSSEAAGAIVLCDRGGNPRVEKSATVAEAGGVGMVLTNVAGGADDTPADLHSVPTVHLAVAEAQRLRAVLSARSDVRARLDPRASAPVPAPVLADFSSRTASDDARGPQFLGADVLAPGVDLLSATSPATDGESWGFVSGTSYAAARVAGAAALLLGDRPGRSVDEVVSSVVSTSYQVLGDASPLAQGNGLIDPSRVLNPGLAVSAEDPGFDGWLRGDRAPARVQTPSLVLGDVTAPTRVVRTLRNVSGSRATWTFAATGVPGYRVTAQPASVTLAPGERVDVRLRIVPAPGSRSFVGGRLEWDSSTRPDVRLPLALRSSELSATRAAPRRGASSTVTTTSGSVPAVTVLLPSPR